MSKESKDLCKRAYEYVVDDDFPHAIYLYEQAAKMNDSEAFRQLGLIYLELFDGHIDKRKALKYFEQGASLKDSDCQADYGWLLLEIGSQTDKKTGLEWVFFSGDFKDEEKSKNIRKWLRALFEVPLREGYVPQEVDLDYLRHYIRSAEKHPKYFGKPLRELLFELRDRYVRTLFIQGVDRAKTLSEINEACSSYSQYSKKDFMKQAVGHFYDRKVAILMKSDLSAEKVLAIFEDDNIPKENASPLLNWLLDSYLDGTNGVAKDMDQAVRVYKMGNADVCNHFFKRIVGFCDKAAERKDVQSLKELVELIPLHNYREYYHRVAKGILEQEKFEALVKKAKGGDMSAALEVARRSQDPEVKRHWYAEHFRHSPTQESFNYLFDHFDSSLGFDSRISLWLHAKRNEKIVLSSAQERKINLGKGAFSCRQTADIKTVDLRVPTIYYITDYYKKAWVDVLPKNDRIRQNHEAFILIKQGKYTHDLERKGMDRYQKYPELDFRKALRNFFGLLSGDWIVCTAPGHEQTLNQSNGVSRILAMDGVLPHNVVLRNTLIQRAYTVEDKVSSLSRNTDPDVDMRSMQANPKINVVGRNVVIVDDITTSTSTLVACHNLIRWAGAKNIVCLAIGKTKEL